MHQGKDKLSKFMSLIEPDHLYKKAITTQCKHFDLKAKELLKYTPNSIRHIQEFLLNKQEENKQFLNQWTENQKKLFDWVFMCFLHHHSLTPEALTESDYEALAELTSCKPVPLIKYHIQTISKQPKRPKWTQLEDSLLFTMLAVEKKYKTVGMWSQISKELFLRGEQNSYKSSRNCRERWFNHIDPSIVKSWSTEEDLILLRSIKSDGKKWSHVISQLKHSKSEHMIKNRYNSLIHKKQKEMERPPKQTEIVDLLIEELKTQLAQEEQERKKQLKIAVEKEESMTKRITRSQSLKKENQNKNQEPHMELIKSNRLMTTSQFIEDDMQKGDLIRWLEGKDIIREEQEPDEPKIPTLNPFESIKFTSTTPLPLTPLPQNHLSFKNWQHHFKD